MKLYQIRLSRAEIDQANRGGAWSDKFAASRKAAFGDFVGQQHYDHVADIQSKDLDYAFQIGNIGPEDKIVRHAPMHSVSVGDVLVADHGVAFIVKPVGFEAVAGWRM